MECRDLGVLPYAQAWKLQDELREARIAGRTGDQLLFVEHPPVFTFGRRDCSEDLLVPAEVIAKEGIEIIKTNRGGRITYHGPGQIVGYFICSLDSVQMGVKEFVCAVEKLLIRTLADFEITATRDPEYPGVWVGRDKIAAIGLNFSHGVSQHGFALNVTPNFNHYQYIIPCGITDRGVTSMERVLGKVPSPHAIKERLTVNQQTVFPS